MVNKQCYFGALVVFFVVQVFAQQYEFLNPIRFPYSPTGNPFVGIFVALAFPIDLRGPADLFVSANFESSYTLPSNQSELQYPPIITSTRAFIYKLLEAKLNGNGFNGTNCLQRTICEAAEFTTINYGVLGDILHILLTPSSSKHEKKIEDYLAAEEFGRKYGQCDKYKKICPLSFLNLISKIYSS